MANFTTRQAFYSLTLQASSAINASVTCNAIPGLKASDQQIFEARGERVYLRRVQPNADRTQISIETVVEHHTFSEVRAVCALKIPGTASDALVVTSDSGRVSVLTYDPSRNDFKVEKLETFGKSGVRRGIPGHFLANDRRGRAFMIAAPEKSKVVYMMQRQPDGTLQISSPHEINQWGVLTYDLCALDTVWDHPIFATLEVDMNELDADTTGTVQPEKKLVYYTVDLSLNHVVRGWSARVADSANKVFGVPGGDSGPSGVLVCSDGMIEYVHQGSQGDVAERLQVPIPRRRRRIEDPERTCFIVSGASFKTKGSNDFFYLLQNEDGDVFKLTMTLARDAQGRRTTTPVDIIIKYYDTLPVAKSLLIIRKGYIYVAPQDGNTQLYFIQDLADSMDEESYNIFSSSDDPPPWYFTPRDLRNLTLAAEVPGLQPLVRAVVDNPLNEDGPQIYALQGTRNQSCLKVIRHGLDLEEFVSSRLGGIFYHKVWSLKLNAESEYHKYLLLTSDRGEDGARTAVLEIGESVESTDDTAFIGTTATVFACLMGRDTHIQVHPRGIRSIYASGQYNDWKASMTVVAAAANDWQLLLGLSSNELVFFFLGDDGYLQQAQDMPEMTGRVTAIAVGPTPRGSREARYAVVGCDDCTIRVISIDTSSLFDLKSIQALSSPPTSIQLVNQLDPNSNTMVAYVHIGLESGLYLRALLDDNGELGEVRTKLLSAESIRLFSVQTHDQNAVVACSSRPWLGYHHPQTLQYTMTPLIAERWEAACPFLSEELQGICAISGEYLSIVSTPRIDNHLSSSSTKLNYTPRSLTRHPDNSIFYVAQSDANCPSHQTLEQTEARFKKQSSDSKREKSAFYVFPEGEESMAGMQGNAHLGLPKFAGHWASCVQAVDPLNNIVVASHEFGNNEAATCAVCVPFESREWETFLAVAVARNIEVTATQAPSSAVHIFSLSDEGRTIKLLHTTQFGAPIYAMHAWKGRLALGVGKELMIYDMGKSALLRKARGEVVDNQIVTIDSMGHRFAIGDVMESVTFVVYKEEYRRIVPFADDIVRRYTTRAIMLDYETVAGGDKWGNLWVVTCPEQASKEADEDSANGHLMNERSFLGGAPHRYDLGAHYYANDLCSGLQKTSLVPGGDEVLFWSGVHGTLGILQPFKLRADLEFFSSLETQMRDKDIYPALTGRDHLMYRCYYAPVKGVIDGDLCERYLTLPYELKQRVAAELDRDVRSVEKKVQEMRTRVAF